MTRAGLLCLLFIVCRSYGNSQDLLRFLLPISDNSFDVAEESFSPYRLSLCEETREALSPAYFITYRWEYHQTYKEHRANRLTSHFGGSSENFRFVASPRSQGFQPTIQLTVHQSNFSTVFEALADETGRYEKRGRTATLDVILPLSPALTFSTAAGHFTDRIHSYQNLQASIDVRPQENVLFTVRGIHRGSSQVIGLKVKDISGILPLDFRVTGFASQLQARILPRFGVLVEYEPLSLSSLPSAVRMD